MPTLNEASPFPHAALGHGATPNVFGSPLELIASAARDATWAIFLARAISTFGATQDFEISIGEIGSEVPIVSDFTKMKIGDGGDYNDSFAVLCFPMKVSQGDRVSIRVKSDASFGVNYEVQLRLFE